MSATSHSLIVYFVQFSLLLFFLVILQSIPGYICIMRWWCLYIHQGYNKRTWVNCLLNASITGELQNICTVRKNSLHNDYVANIHDHEHQTLPPVGRVEWTVGHDSDWKQATNTVCIVLWHLPYNLPIKDELEKEIHSNEQSLNKSFFFLRT